MKKTKIIIPALGLLLLSTAASVSGTVAWFAMNASVDATGLKIQAKSDSVFLLISSTHNTADDIQAENSGAGFTSVNLGVTDLESQLLPSAHDSIGNTAAATATNVSHLKQYELISDTSTKISIDQYNALSSEDKALYQAENANGTNWYYQVADSANSYASSKAKQYLATVDAKYIIHKTVWVTLADGSNDASNLAVKTCAVSQIGTTPKTMSPVKVLITSSTAAKEFSSTGASNDTTVLATAVTSADAVQLDIFLYYNGDDEAVYTNNIANLDGATVSLTFDVNRVQNA